MLVTNHNSGKEGLKFNQIKVRHGTLLRMKCPRCAADNPEGNNFCSSCSSLLNPQLLPLVRSQVEEYMREYFKDQKVIDVETTEAIAKRFLMWGKWFLFPGTLLLTILGVTLGIIGFRDFSDVHKAAQQAVATANTATKTAEDATLKAQEAKRLSDDAITTIHTAMLTVNSQVSSAQQLSEKFSGLESKTAGQLASANKHVEDRMGELDRKVDEANKAISVQQAKLVSTNELVTAMFSKSQVEMFQPSQGNTSTFAVLPLPKVPQNARPGAAKAMAVMLLKSAPIYQTIQINFHIFVQPKSSYFVSGNQLTFLWGDPPDNLKQWPLEVSYVPNPTYDGPIYKELTVTDKGISAK